MESEPPKAHPADPSVSGTEGPGAGSPAGRDAGAAAASHAPPAAGSGSGVPAGEKSTRRLSPEWIERVRHSDPEALGLFFDTYFDRVYGLLVRLLGERSAAEDMVQEVFLKVHRAAHQLDPARDPGPWLTAIAYNACRDLWRSSAHRLAKHSGSIDADPAIAARLGTDHDDPERLAIADQRRRLVLEAIGRLPEPLRVAIVLYDYQGLSHHEIGELTGIHHAAARKRYSRALAALAKLLEGRLE